MFRGSQGGLGLGDIRGGSRTTGGLGLLGHEGVWDSLEQVLPTLFLRREAGHRPHFDLDAGIELLPSHVPHALVGRGHRLILRRESLTP